MVAIEPASSSRDKEELDELLWRILWKPLGLPRNVRQGFKVEGDELELVALGGGLGDDRLAKRGRPGQGVGLRLAEELDRD